MKKSIHFTTITILVALACFVSSFAFNTDPPFETEESCQYTSDIETASEILVGQVEQAGNEKSSTYTINWTIPAGSTTTGSNHYYLYVGDTISFNLSYAPSGSSNVKVGVYTPKDTFRCYTVTNGTVNQTMTMNISGYYRVRIQNNTASTITVTGSFTINSTNKPTHSWFCQSNAEVGTTWGYGKLNNLYFPNISYNVNVDPNQTDMWRNTPLYTLSSYSPGNGQMNKGHINKYGCSITSIAMIFHNLGAITSTSKYDFRSGASSQLVADPFSIVMANVGWQNITYNTGNSHFEITNYQNYQSPAFPYWGTIASAFGKTATRIDLTGMTSLQKADIIATYVNNHPEGILVRVDDSHSVVFTDTTHTISSSLNGMEIEEIIITEENEHEISYKEYLREREAAESLNMPRNISSTIYDSEFTCYDPGTQYASQGNGVLYSNSFAASQYGGIDMVTYIYFFS